MFIEALFLVSQNVVITQISMEYYSARKMFVEQVCSFKCVYEIVQGQCLQCCIRSLDGSKSPLISSTPLCLPYRSKQADGINPI